MASWTAHVLKWVPILIAMAALLALALVDWTQGPMRRIVSGVPTATYSYCPLLPASSATRGDITKCPACNIDNRTTLAEFRECIVISDQKLIFPLVWKAGTTSLTVFAKCMKGTRHVITTGGEEERLACEHVPPDWHMVALVRQDGAMRYLSGYIEFLFRNQRYPRAGETAQATFRRFAREATHTSHLWWAHVWPQVDFLRAHRRPVKHVVYTEAFADGITALLGPTGNHTECAYGDKRNSRANPKKRKVVGYLTEAEFEEVLRLDVGTRRAVCSMLTTDAACLGVDTGVANCSAL